MMRAFSSVSVVAVCGLTCLSLVQTAIAFTSIGTNATLSGKPSSPVQGAADEAVGSDAYRARHYRYMRQVWPEYVDGLSDADLDQKLDEALETADRLSIPRDMSAPVGPVIVSLVAPDVIENEQFFWTSS